jgi:hypothetical protein
MNSYSNRFITNKYNTIDENCKGNCLNYSMNQVSKHNSKYNCMISVNGKIYDITKYKKYLNQNGGNNILNIKCGNNYDNVNEANMFRDTIYRDYIIGDIKYYNLMKILKILFKLIILVLFIAIYKKTNNKYVLIPLSLYCLINIISFIKHYKDRNKIVDNIINKINKI